jgi:hypothetical protein
MPSEIGCIGGSSAVQRLSLPRRAWLGILCAGAVSERREQRFFSRPELFCKSAALWCVRVVCVARWGAVGCAQRWEARGSGGWLAGAAARPRSARALRKVASALMMGGSEPRCAAVLRGVVFVSLADCCVALHASARAAWRARVSAAACALALVVFVSAAAWCA